MLNWSERRRMCNSRTHAHDNMSPGTYWETGTQVGARINAVVAMVTSPFEHAVQSKMIKMAIDDARRLMVAPEVLPAVERAKILAGAEHLDASRAILVLSGQGAPQKSVPVSYRPLVSTLTDAGAKDISVKALAGEGYGGLHDSADGVATLIRSTYAASGKQIDIVAHCKGGLALVLALHEQPDLVPMVRRVAAVAVPFNGIDGLVRASDIPLIAGTQAAEAVHNIVNVASENLLGAGMRDMLRDSKVMNEIRAAGPVPETIEWLSIASDTDRYINPADAVLPVLANTRSIVIHGPPEQAGHSPLVRTNPEALRAIVDFFAA